MLSTSASSISILMLSCILIHYLSSRIGVCIALSVCIRFLTAHSVSCLAAHLSWSWLEASGANWLDSSGEAHYLACYLLVRIFSLRRQKQGCCMAAKTLLQQNAMLEWDPSAVQLLRCMCGCSDLADTDLGPMSIGLSHSLSRYKLKFSPDKVHIPGILNIAWCVCRPFR